MEIMEQIKIENKILNNPENYAAIYARISSKKDNNSIEAQISKAKIALNNENLLLYAVYTDHISGRTVSPPDREGFGKLLADAKAGCFKTIVVYKHDRIARSLNHWISLKSQLKKLGIKIIFSDDTEYTSDNSLQGDFIENLLVMVAELEPNNINERVSYGREQRRSEGIYNSANHIPFGYDRKNTNSKDTSKGKSYYEIKPLETIFIQHLFSEANDVLGKKDIQIEKIKETLSKVINKFLEINLLTTLNSELKSFAENIKTKIMKHSAKETFLQNIIEALCTYLKEKSIDDIKTELKVIQKHFSNTGNLQNILSNPIYAGYMLLNSKEEHQGIIIKDKKIPILNEQSFVRIRNVAAIIDKKTFSNVYSFMLMPQILKGKEPNYLFKGKLKCGNCNVYLHFTDGLLQCTNAGKRTGCKAFGKNNLIEAILNIILDDAFNNSNEGFNKFRDTIDDNLKYLRNDLENLRKTKMILLKEYLKNKDKRCIEAVNTNQDEINFILHKIANYEYEIDNINKLQKLLKHYNKSDIKSKKSNLDISKIKSTIISYIISNQDYFNSIFDKLIKEIKVKPIEQKNDFKCRFTVKYEFKYNKPGDILACIDK